MNNNLKLKEWNESYERKENFMFYPKEESVKFINRFVRKRIGTNEFIDILGKSEIKGLDFGCGIGAQTILMHEFGIEAYGIDISNEAINKAKEIAIAKGYPDLAGRFLIYDGENIPFENDFFDICIAEGVLDSMYFDLAKKCLKEIERVVKKLVFISLISGDDHKHYREYCEDEIVEEQHERATVQSYYNFTKINKLIEGTSFKIIWCRLMQEIGVDHKYKYGRYHLVLKKCSQNEY